MNVRGRVLLADDDEGVREACGGALEHEGFHVTYALDGAEALRLLDADEFDLVISDYRMPGAHGIDVLRAALAVQPRARRVLMSASLDEWMVQTAERDAKVDALFEKPLTNESLSQAIAVLAGGVLAGVDREVDGERGQSGTSVK